MTRLLIAALLTITVATAQTTPNATKPGSATPATNLGQSKGPGGASPSFAGAASTRASKSATPPDRPIPEQPLRTKLRNANTINPNYNREKDRKGRGTKREYTPRRTASGVRKDTLNQRRPGDPVQN